MIKDFRCLSLDLGTDMGYYLDVDDTLGVKNPSVIRFSKGARYKEFYATINNFIDTFEINTLIYEDANRQIGWAAKIYFGFVGVLELIGLQRDIPVVKINTKTAKKHFAGKGNATKEDMMKKCLEIGIDHGGSDDAADAVGVYMTYRDLILKAGYKDE